MDKNVHFRHHKSKTNVNPKRYSYSITVSKKQKQGLHLTFWRNGAVWYYRMIFLPAATQPR